MRIKINYNKIFLFILLFINIPPAFFIREDNIAKIFNILQIFMFFICMIKYTLFLKRNKKISFIFLITVFWGIFILSTFLNGHGKMHEAIEPLITTFSLCSIYIVNLKKNEEFIDIASFYFKLLIYINFVTILIFPNGLYLVEGNVNAHYFLGHRNNSVEYILPALLFSIMKDFNKKGKYSVSTFLLLIASVLSVILTWSANAILVLFFVIAVLFIPLKDRINKCLNIANFSIAYIVLFFSIIVFKLQNHFEWLIVGILHRSLDFTNRVRIWDKTLYWINKSFILGYGFENSEYKELKIYHPNSCHNYLLDFMYMGGIAMVLVLVLIIILTAIKIKKAKDNKICKIIEMFILAYFILGFATPIHKNVLCIMFLILCVGYYCSDLIAKKGEVKNE